MFGEGKDLREPSPQLKTTVMRSALLNFYVVYFSTIYIGISSPQFVRQIVYLRFTSRVCDWLCAATHNNSSTIPTSSQCFVPSLSCLCHPNFAGLPMLSGSANDLFFLLTISQCVGLGYRSITGRCRVSGKKTLVQLVVLGTANSGAVHRSSCPSACVVYR